MKPSEKAARWAGGLVGFALSVVNSKVSSHIYTNKDVIKFMKDYGHDVTGPASYYFIISSCGIGNPEISAGITFGICSLAEMAQYYHLYHGTFDPYDFIAYAAGTGAAYGLDKILMRGKSGKA